VIETPLALRAPVTQQSRAVSSVGSGGYAAARGKAKIRAEPDGASQTLLRDSAAKGTENQPVTIFRLSRA
jgi:nucleoid-associated protein YgaU